MILPPPLVSTLARFRPSVTPSLSPDICGDPEEHSYRCIARESSSNATSSAAARRPCPAALLSDLHVYDSVAMGWTDLSAAAVGASPSARYYHGFTSASALLFVHGGVDASGGKCEAERTHKLKPRSIRPGTSRPDKPDKHEYWRIANRAMACI